ncbi:hypothetical protein [Pseudomonas fontis]|uniref:Lipoprotein n=1 Tax=Pseudomonas fontis TaxID=2942633 RepID=A0ABT5NLJ1_9PSED|nr:hypothetical protein [Pseudomonas fontis]MDD0974964.1 hypothetical protein [Pseudomonas fontis]MDD0989405.1 hypothetical protein [Pseudomonas fontis]
MKLILKRVAPEIEVTCLSDSSSRFVLGKPGGCSPFALHAESGEVLPCQVSTTMISEPGEPVRLTVVFTVDGDKLVVQGDGL